MLDTLQLPNGQVLANRFFKSAMSETMADKKGAPSNDLVALFDYWAKQEVGVLVSGNIMVDGRYLGEPGNVVLDSDSHLEQFRSWAKVGQKNGTPIWLQLNHPGKPDVSFYKSNTNCTECCSYFRRIGFCISSAERDDVI